MISTDIDTLARTIWGESRNQPLNGQISVAYVIKNRARYRSMSISAVCKQPLQFSCWNEGDPNKAKILSVSLDNSPTFIEAYGVACLVISGSIPDPVNGADHYFTTKNVLNLKVWPPVWAHSMSQVAVIGDHTFLRS